MVGALKFFAKGNMKKPFFSRCPTGILNLFLKMVINRLLFLQI